jgi:hypothetical protein
VTKRDAVRQTQAAMLDFREQSTGFVNVELDLAITFCKLGLVTANEQSANATLRTLTTLSQ